MYVCMYVWLYYRTLVSSLSRLARILALTLFSPGPAQSPHPAFTVHTYIQGDIQQTCYNILHCRNYFGVASHKWLLFSLRIQSKDGVFVNDHKPPYIHTYSIYLTKTLSSSSTSSSSGGSNSSRQVWIVILANYTHIQYIHTSSLRLHSKWLSFSLRIQSKDGVFANDHKPAYRYTHIPFYISPNITLQTHIHTYIYTVHVYKATASHKWLIFSQRIQSKDGVLFAIMSHRYIHMYIHMYIHTYIQIHTNTNGQKQYNTSEVLSQLLTLSLSSLKYDHTYIYTYSKHSYNIAVWTSLISTYLATRPASSCRLFPSRFLFVASWRSDTPPLG